MNCRNFLKKYTRQESVVILPSVYVTLRPPSYSRFGGLICVVVVYLVQRNLLLVDGRPGIDDVGQYKGNQ